jgi:hypothetical protein
MSLDTAESKEMTNPANGKNSPLIEIEAHHQGKIQRLPVKHQEDNASDEQDDLKQGKQLFDRAVEKLLNSENVIVLLGSGASLALNTEAAKVAPSMTDLWDACEKSHDKFDEIKTTVGYNDKKNDIEALLSRCKGFVEYVADKAKGAPIEAFIKAAEKTIYEQTNFADKPELSGDIESLHGILLERLGRRSPRLGRLKVFTTNYDRCVEVAAEQKGFVIIDGFRSHLDHRIVPDGSITTSFAVARCQRSEKHASRMLRIFTSYTVPWTGWRKMMGVLFAVP